MFYQTYGTFAAKFGYRQVKIAMTLKIDLEDSSISGEIEVTDTLEAKNTSGEIPLTTFSDLHKLLLDSRRYEALIDDPTAVNAENVFIAGTVEGGAMRVRRKKGPLGKPHNEIELWFGDLRIDAEPNDELLASLLKTQSTIDEAVQRAVSKVRRK